MTNPAGGCLLHIDLGDPSLAVCDWFFSLAAAKEALSLLAEQLGREVYNDGFSLDLTEPGGPPRKAWLDDRAPLPASAPAVKLCVECWKPVVDPQLEGAERCATCADP